MELKKLPDRLLLILVLEPLILLVFTGRSPQMMIQITIQEAGDWLDLALMELVEKKYTGAQVTRTWSAVGKKPHPMLVRKSRK